MRVGRAIRLPLSGARRGVAQIALGTVVGQGVVILVAPLTSRLYEPADFAVLQVFTGLVAIGAVVASLRLELAIPLARTGLEARAVFRVGVISLVAIASVIGVVGLVTAPYWAYGHTLRTLRALWWLVPLTVAILAVYQLISAAWLRAEQYDALAGRNAIQGIGAATGQVMFGVAGMGALGLMLALALGRLAAAIPVRGERPLFGETEKPSPAQMRAALARYRKFPLVTTWSAFLNNAAQWAPAFVFPLTYGAAAAGWLAFTMRLLSVPITVIGQSVAQVFIGRGAAAQRTDSGQLPRLTWLAVRRLALVGAPPALLLAIAAPWAFGVIFGSAWEQSGLYARVLAVAFFVQFVGNPIGNVFNLAERPAIGLVWDACRLVLAIAAPTVVWMLGGSDVAGVAAYAGVLVFSYVGVLGLAWWVLR
jgi:O-antigen/teichoic acid export membrane protein